MSEYAHAATALQHTVRGVVQSRQWHAGEHHRCVSQPQLACRQLARPPHLSEGSGLEGRWDWLPIFIRALTWGMQWKV